MAIWPIRLITDAIGASLLN